MSIRQTRGAILFLCAQYRAILLKGAGTCSRCNRDLRSGAG